METVDAINVLPQNVENNGSKRTLEELFIIAYELEQRVKDLERLESSTKVNQTSTSLVTSTEVNQTSTSLVTSTVKDKDNERHVPSLKKIQQEATRREQAAAKRMQDLIRQFGSILRQITQHKCAWPFMQPVDVEGLGLLDYYEVIDRPMDFSTIKNQMEAKDGTGYKHIRDVYADVRLIFQNAMKYNDDTSKVHRMAKTLLSKFEDKWEQFLPKVDNEEKRREEEEAEGQQNLRLAQYAAHARIAKELSSELFKVDAELEDIKETTVKKCRKMSIEDKRNIGRALSMLGAEDLRKALEIVSQNNPSFPKGNEDIELDLDALNEYTLWRLKYLVRHALDTPDNSLSNSVDITASKRRKKVISSLGKS